MKKINIILIVGVASLSMAASANETYEYDALGRLVKVSYENNKDISYSYDAVGNRQTVSVVDGVGSSATPSDINFIVVPLTGLTLIPIP